MISLNSNGKLCRESYLQLNLLLIPSISVQVRLLDRFDLSISVSYCLLLVHSGDPGMFILPQMYVHTQKCYTKQIESPFLFVEG